ncbi:hypothetical protein [Flavobacterium lipolyticum]|uniref:Uncharacterized protein n=1 Tax=Flavobacterium lipolyticum TaxID=2893754 RepID=A0ABS8LWG7_9FLAO|nr:hypothetical protein [Flavobacterium sp. F-126]MCC9016917.1 hypothetical protein [Flavobacterium sp. F-126]
MILKFLSKIALIADNQQNFIERLKYFLQVISTLGPIVMILEGLSGWFVENRRFSVFIFAALVGNLVIGVIYHLRKGSFSWEQFIFKNCKMAAILVIAYTMLEMIAITAGENILADGYRTVIQVSTLLWPGGKILKNLYILSNKQFPPAFIMERLYNFEKSGNINELFPEQNKTE